VVIRALDRKVLRDIWSLRGQVLTIALMIGAGVAVLIASVSAWWSLVHEQRAFYAETRFADLFVEMKRAPRALLPRLAATPGVAAVEGRVVGEGRVEWPRSETPVSAQILSLPAIGYPELNRLRLQAGRWPDPARYDEAILHVAFASAWGVRPGDAVTVIMNGRRETFRVVGVAQAPDYIFASPSGNPLPDDRGFAVIWAGEEAVARAFDMEGAFNQLIVALAPAGSKEAVIAELDRLLDGYGGRGAYGRRDQPSHRFLEDELTQQRSTAVIMPALFLGVAAFLLSVVLGRMVEAQREQVAALKALGYPAWPIALHFAKFAGVLSLLGSVIGGVAGAWMGAGMLSTYRPFFRFPETPFLMPAWALPLGFAASLAAALLGALGAVRRILRLPAAEGMRPAAPAAVRVSALGRIGSRLGPRQKIVLMGLLGRPLRTALTVLGLSFAVPMVVLGLFWRDALEDMVSLQFDYVERGDAVVTLTDARASRVVGELAGLPGVLAAEGQRIIAARLRAGHRTYRLGLTGVSEFAELRVPRDASLKPIAIPQDGLALSRRLAQRLAVKTGDLVQVEVQEGKRPTFVLPVAALVDDVIGMNAYAQNSLLNRLMREDDLVSHVALRVDPALALDLWRALEERPRVAATGVKENWLRVFHGLIANLVIISAVFLTGFGLIIAIGIVYNSARVALHERSWEMASLRVLGFTRAEISRILLTELGIAMLAATPPGLVLSQVFVNLIVASHSGETFAIPPRVHPATFAVAVLIVFAAAGASAFAVVRQVNRLDLVAALKARD
jgi:putative ABC transport system permease protein